MNAFGPKLEELKNLIVLHSQVAADALANADADANASTGTGTADLYSPDEWKAMTIAYFSDPSVKRLPFPSKLKHGRIAVDKSGYFECFGREKFDMLVEDVAEYVFDQQEHLQLYGNIGSGKSHMITMLVLYLHIMHTVAPNEYPIPIFISKCGGVIGNRCMVYKEIAKAINLCSFHDGVTAIQLNNGTKGEEQCQFINNYFQNNAKSFCFIYDDWNAIEKLANNDLYIHILDFLTTLPSLQDFEYMITGLSAQSPSAQSQSTSYTPPKRFYLYGGLSDREWDQWKVHIKYLKELSTPIEMMTAAEMPAAEMPAEEAVEKTAGMKTAGIKNAEEPEGKAKENTAEMFAAEMTAEEKVKDNSRVLGELEFLTGRIPLLVRAVCGFDGSWEDKQDYWMRNSGVGVGGSWIFQKLDEFTKQYGPNKDRYSDKDTHVRMMASAIGSGYKGAEYPLDYEHRFFYGEGNCLLPICGLVRKLMARVLVELDRSVLRNQFDQAWVKDVLSQSDTDTGANASVRGFAFELYAIGAVITHPEIIDLPANTVMEVVRFDGNYPEPLIVQRNAADFSKCYFYWPNKFNLRHIDFVVSVSASASASASTSASGIFHHAFAQVQQYLTSSPSPVVEEGPKTKKRKASSENTQPAQCQQNRLQLIAGQITLQTPQEHKGTASFYTVKHEGGKYDYERYIPENCNRHLVLHSLYWILPSTTDTRARCIGIDGMDIEQKIKFLTI